MIQLPEFLKRLQAQPQVCDELYELANFLDARTNQVFNPLPGLEASGLKLHSAYQIREILAAIGYFSETAAPSFREGVLRLNDEKIELMFVTLDKSEAMHEGVAYDDYAISPSQFHWQSQNSASATSPAGQRYIESSSNGWSFQLFVRLDKKAAYRACGAVEFLHYHGERPLNITWRLECQLSAELFQEYSVLR